MITLAKHFGAELIAAGLNNGIAWNPDGSVLGRENLTDEQNSALDALIAAHDPLAVPVPTPTRITKADLWRRATTSEAEAMAMALANADVRLREMYAAAIYISINDPEFPAFKAGIEAAIGIERAAVVLEPTEFA